jgi:hypothetical protein
LIDLAVKDDGELTHNNNNRAICSGNKSPKLIRTYEDQQQIKDSK